MYNVKFLFVLPPGMYFSKSQAGSIELCTYDIATSDFFKDKALVTGPLVDDQLDEHFIGLAAGNDHEFENNLKSLIETINPRLIIINQQFRLAARMRKKFPHIKFVVYRHNHVKKRKGFSKFWMSLQLRSIDHFLFCSDYIRDEFCDNFPSYKNKSSTLYNAINLSLWTRGKVREKTLLFIGRPTDDKGLLEFLHAGALVVKQYPDWRIKVIISHAHLDADYTAHIKNFIAQNDHFELFENIEFSSIIKNCQTASIMVVPSKWAEPFGRTAIEAHAGGAALISSGQGGLAEASEEAALFLNVVSVEEIYSRTVQLIENPSAAEALRQKGYALVDRKFSQNAVYSQLNHLLHSIIAEKK